jgi:8-oxo-dGTP pyrophosphatase MutT (NUDIX family)
MEELLEKMKKDAEEPKRREFGACVVVINKNKFLLLKRNKKAGFAPDTWGFPGGGSDPGEEPEACAIRETYEETGLKVRNLKFVKMITGNKGKFVYFFVSSDYEGEVDMEKVKDEHQDFAWITPKQMGDYTLTDAVEGVIGKIIKRGLAL